MHPGSDPESWPIGLRRLALVCEVEQALAWARELRRGEDMDEDGGGSFQLGELRRRLAAARRLLAVLPDPAEPLAAAARSFAQGLAGRGDVPPEGSWPEAAALRAAIARALPEALPPPASDADEWAWRVARLAARPWLGGHAWDAPAGWAPLMERAVAQAERWTARRERERWRTRQVKEKFGTLRWYVDGGARLQTIVDFAELASAGTCQACGAPGRLRSDLAWKLTLCEAHHAMRSAGDAVASLSYPRRSGLR